MKMYERIKMYMDDNGIKQNYVADKSGIPENTLSMIFTGKRKLYADEFVAIIFVLGIDPNYIITYRSEK